MRHNSNTGIQAAENRIIKFLTRYNFQRVCNLIKKGHRSDRQILELGMLRSRGRPQKKIKKPKNKVYEELRIHLSLKESLDIVLDHLLSLIALNHLTNNQDYNIMKALNAYSKFKFSLLTGSPSQSTKDSKQGLLEKEMQFLTQKMFLINFPLFIEIDQDVQLQIHHYVHKIIEMRLLNDNTSFNLDVIEDLRYKPVICPYFATAIYLVLLSMLFSTEFFTSCLFVICALLQASAKSFNVLRKNLNVNLDMPETVLEVRKTDQTEFNTFITEFFYFVEIYSAGETFTNSVNSLIHKSENIVSAQLRGEDISKLIAGWKLMFSSFNHLFYAREAEDL